MAKKFYLPKNDSARFTWYVNFCIKLLTYATKLGMLPAAIAKIVADKDAWGYIVGQFDGAKTFEHTSATFKQTMSEGAIGTVPIDYPVYSVPAVIPAAVPAGIFKRVRKLVNSIKANPAYTTDMGADLGIIGADDSSSSAVAEDPKPALKGKGTADYVQLKYTKGKFDGARFEERRGTATGFSLLEKVNKSVYNDKRPNLVPGQPEVREYRAWFFIGDEIVGQVSDVLSITVTG